MGVAVGAAVVGGDVSIGVTVGDGTVGVSLAAGDGAVGVGVSVRGGAVGVGEEMGTAVTLGVALGDFSKPKSQAVNGKNVTNHTSTTHKKMRFLCWNALSQLDLCN